MKIAVLASTNGTDLQAIIDAIKANELNVELAVVVSHKECYAIQRAREQGFETRVENNDEKIDAVMTEFSVDLVCLVGYNLILSEWFTEKYTVINIHPSLLPAFPGWDQDVHKTVIEHGCKVSGCTIHVVTKDIDAGPIIAQRACEVTNDETVDSLKDKVQELEKKLYPEIIQKFADNKIHINGRKVVVE